MQWFQHGAKILQVLTSNLTCISVSGDVSQDVTLQSYDPGINGMVISVFLWDVNLKAILKPIHSLIHSPTHLLPIK